MNRELIGAVEAGGTTFRCAVGLSALDIQEAVTISTGQPGETIAAVIDFLHTHGPISHLGVASFGPINVDATSAEYGIIQDTPKLPWRSTPLLSLLRDALQVPVCVQTDVMAAALVECAHGAGQDLKSVVYVTVGTGLGAALAVNGKPAQGLFHSEMGHMLVPRHVSDRQFTNVCPYHEECVEGFASATAISERWGCEPHDLEQDHPAWELEANYLAIFCANLMRVVAPHRILLGGGVMQAAGLLERVRQKFVEIMSGYHTVDDNDVTELIMRPALEPNSGLMGAMLLADHLRNV